MNQPLRPDAHQELLRRIALDLIDGDDEALELELEDRHREARRHCFRELSKPWPPANCVAPMPQWRSLRSVADGRLGWTKRVHLWRPSPLRTRRCRATVACSRSNRPANLG